MVQMAGIEPARFIQPQDFKSCASTSSATSALIYELACLNDNTYYNMVFSICQYYFAKKIKKIFQFTLYNLNNLCYNPFQLISNHFIGAQYIGSIRVSKTPELGSTPSAPAKLFYQNHLIGGDTIFLNILNIFYQVLLFLQ